MCYERITMMNKTRFLLFFLLICLVFSVFGSISAQQTYPAAGSLESSGDGLWNYYRGKTKQTVKRNAPMFEKISDNPDISGFGMEFTLKLKKSSIDPAKEDIELRTIFKNKAKKRVCFLPSPANCSILRANDATWAAGRASELPCRL